MVIMRILLNKTFSYKKTFRSCSTIWYPKTKRDLDKIANNTLEAGKDIDVDHPGFSDKVYRERRKVLANHAIEYKFGHPVPFIKYINEELYTWNNVLQNLEPRLQKYACSQFLNIWPDIKTTCRYKNNIPQIADINQFLYQRSNFTIRPCAGLLTSRDFLNALAYRTFFSTQYIRHKSVPYYTPEPDICHEFIGHVPMFAIPDFADLSQKIGIASLGATDTIIDKLAKCYWYSIEFGLIKEGNKVKAYGAGLLSSFGELEYACNYYRPAGNKYPKYKKWDINSVCKDNYPITKYQPQYFIIDKFEDIKMEIKRVYENN